MNPCRSRLLHTPQSNPHRILKTSATLILGALLIFATPAAFASQIRVRGTFLRADEKHIVLKDLEANTEFRVPRSRYPNIKGLIGGQAQIEVELKASEFLEANPELGAKAPNQAPNKAAGKSSDRR